MGFGPPCCYRLVPDNTLHKSTSKHHKMDEKSTHFVVHVSPSIFGLKKNSPLRPAPIQKRSGLFNLILFPMLTEKRAPPFCQFFWFGSNPKKSSLCRALVFLLHLGTHPSKTGGELLYYHLYHEEAPVYLDVRPQLFNRPFIIFFGLSSQ